MEQKLQQQLKELGSKLESPPSSKDALLKLLKQAASCLSELDQSPSSSILESMQPFLDAIVRPELLKHQDKDVKLLVATCICEITRITAPEAPYNDDILKDIFQLIVGTFSGLSESSGPSFARRLVILETVAKYRSCVVMLDLECDDLVNEMFSTFFSVASDDHPENVLSSMQTIMTVVLEESEDVREDLLLIILSSLGRNRTGVTTAARQLAMNVIEQCAGKLEVGIKQFLISSISGDNRSVNSDVDHHEVIYDVYRCAPQILAGVVPYLTGEMLTDQLDTRLQAVTLVGDLFALPGSMVAEAFQPIFSEFLKRLADRVAVVRMSVLKHVRSCLLSDPTRSEAPQIFSALCDRLLDYDENVRKQVVNVICDVACHAPDSIPVETIKLVAERLRDKSLLVKKHTMERLAEIFRVYFARYSDGAVDSDAFDWIPGKILRCFYDKDFRSDTIESVLSGFLYSTGSSIRERIKHWMRIFSGFDKVEVKALEKIMEQKQRLQLEMLKYLSLRQHQDDDAPDIQKKKLFCFRMMSRSFAEPAKAEESFQCLDQLKDVNIWKILTSLLDPNTSLHHASTGRDDLLRILGEKHRLYEFLGMLSFKCSYSLFNKEHVNAILLEAAEQKSAGNTHHVKSCMDMLVILAHFSPSLLGGAEEKLIDFLKDDNEIVKEGTLHVLAKAGGTIRERLSESSSSIDLILERLCLEGSRRHAKYAVHALAAITKDDGLKSLSVLYKRLVDMLEERTNLPAVLQSLGCIAQAAMPVFETRESEIERFIKSKILQCNNEVEECAKEDWDERSELCQLKIYGLKTLVKAYLPVKDAHLRPGIDELLGLLRSLLSFGEVAQDIVSSSVDKAHLRLAAAKAVLRLSRIWEHKIPVDIFYLTLRTSEISFPQARRLFLHKVHQYMKDRLLDAKYVCAFLFNADKSRPLESEEEKDNLADIIQMYQKTKARQTPLPMDANSLTAYPEYMIPYLVHALAHHFCPNIDECKDVKEYELIYRQLYLTTSMLVHKEEDNKSETGSNKEENIPLIVSIYQTIKCSEDVVDATKSKNSHAISDLGLSIIKRLAYKDNDLQGLMQSIPLPPMLYKPYEKKEGDDSQASEGQTWLADESVISQFEALKLESNKLFHSENVNGEAHEDSEIDGNDVPLGKIIKRLKSQGSKGAKVKKSKSLPLESKETENDVDILKMVREINSDSLGAINKFESSNGHEDFPTEKSKSDQGHQNGKKRKAGDAALISVPKRRRSLSGHSALKSSLKLSSKASAEKLHQARDTTTIDPVDLHDSENKSSARRKKNESIESGLLSSDKHKKGSMSSKIKRKDSDWSHSDEEKPNDEAVDGNMENLRTPMDVNDVKTDDDMKSATGPSKMPKRKSIVGLAKCSSKQGRFNIADLIGYRIKVWWPMDKQFYEGTVKSYDPIKRKHVVLYDDGDVEVLRLERERWEVISSSHKPGKKSSSLGSALNKQVPQRQRSKGSGGSHQKNKNIVKIVKGKRTPKKNLKRAQISVLKGDFTEPGEEGKANIKAASEVREMDSGDSHREDAEAKSESLTDRKEPHGDWDSEATRGKESSELSHESDEEVKSDPNDQPGKDVEDSPEDPKRDDEKKGMEESNEGMEGNDFRTNESEPGDNAESADVKSEPSTAKKSRKGSLVSSNNGDDEIPDDEPLSKWKHKVGKSRKKSGR